MVVLGSKPYRGCTCTVLPVQSLYRICVSSPVTVGHVVLRIEGHASVYSVFVFGTAEGGKSANRVGSECRHTEHPQTVQELATLPTTAMQTRQRTQQQQDVIHDCQGLSPQTCGDGSMAPRCTCLHECTLSVNASDWRSYTNVQSICLGLRQVL